MRTFAKQNEGAKDEDDSQTKALGASRGTYLMDVSASSGGAVLQQ